MLGGCFLVAFRWSNIQNQATAPSMAELFGLSVKLGATLIQCAICGA